MRTSLATDQWDTVPGGSLRAPSGATFVRRSSRLKRKEADALIAAGAPLVLHDYGSGLLDWYDADDAPARWAAVRGAVTSETLRPRGDLVWTAGIWATVDDEVAVFLTGHC